MQPIYSETTQDTMPAPAPTRPPVPSETELARMPISNVASFDLSELDRGSISYAKLMLRHYIAHRVRITRLAVCAGLYAQHNASRTIKEIQIDADIARLTAKYEQRWGESLSRHAKPAGHRLLKAV